MGNILLSFNYLYLRLGLLVSGSGCFKTNFICLLNQFYPQKIEKNKSIMTLYYVMLNIGAAIAPIVCALLQSVYGYKISFLASSIGMFFGIIFFICYSRSLSDQYNLKYYLNRKALSLMCYIKSIFILLSFTLLISMVLYENYTFYVLLISGLITSFILYKKIKLLSKNDLNNLVILFLLTLVATLFWLLDAQLGSSISLFLDRNVAKDGISTGAFQSVGSIAIIIFGFVIAVFYSKKKTINLKSNFALEGFGKIIIGLSILTFGYMLMALSAFVATKSGLSSLWLPVIAMSFIGVAELWIDPVVLSNIGRFSLKNMNNSCVAVYHLFVGALANFISGKVSVYSAVPKSFLNGKNLLSTANIYYQLFSQIVCISFGVIIFLFLLYIIISQYKKSMVFSPKKLIFANI